MNSEGYAFMTAMSMVKTVVSWAAVVVLATLGTPDILDGVVAVLMALAK